MKSAEPKSSASNVLQRKSEATTFFQQEESRETFFGSKQADAPFFRSAQNNPVPEKLSTVHSSPSTVQTKLKIGAPDDQFEREADATADKVVQRLGASPSGGEEKGGSTFAAPRQPFTVQRKCAECEQEEVQRAEELSPAGEQVQMKPIFESAVEPQAVEGDIQRKPIFESNMDEPSVSDGDGSMSIQRKCEKCEDDEKKTLQDDHKITRKSLSAPVLATTTLADQLAASKGGGFRMPEAVRMKMEAAFNADFSSVRIHTDGNAMQMSRDLNAQAFTHGQDIYFNAGKFDTGSAAGQHLLAHELTHVVQQNGAAVKPKVSAKSAVPFENEDIKSGQAVQKTSNTPVPATIPSPATPADGASIGISHVSPGPNSFNHPEEKIHLKEELENTPETPAEHAHQAVADSPEPPIDPPPNDEKPASPAFVTAGIQAKPDIQREEEVSKEELAKELRESELEQTAAISDTEATSTRNQAKEEGAQAIEQAKEALPKAKAPPKQPLPEEAKQAGGMRMAKPKKKKAAQVEDVRQPNDPELGPGGQQLAEDSANACQDAADKSQQLADNQQAHDNAAQKTEQAEGAVVPPAEEGQSRSNAEQVSTVDGAPEPTPDEQAAKEELDASIEESVPKNIEGMNEFASGKKGQVVGNKVLAVTTEQVGNVQGTYTEINNTPPPTEAETPTEIPAIEQAPETPTLNVGRDAVPELKPEQTDVSQYEKDADSIYEKEGITPDLKAETEKVDSGDIGEANAERKNLKDKVATEPAKVRELAQQEQKGVETDMKKEEQKTVGAMKAKRKEELEGSQQEQKKTKSVMEQKREAVTLWINTRYEKAKKFVDDTLKNLEQQSLASFDAGQQSLSITFERNVKQRINAWKAERYSGLFGGVKWLKDKLFGIDKFPAVKQIFSDEREAYIKGIDALIVSINKSNNETIKSCKDEIAKADKEIQQYVGKLGPELRDVGKKAQKETVGKLKALDNKVDEEKKKLQEALCKKRDEAIKAIDKKIEQMKSEMSGLVNKLGKLLLELAKKFFKWAIEKLGGSPDKILGLLNKGAAALKKLFTDPIGFFKNLGSAVGKGIDGFTTNFGEYLKKGISEWLLGAMGDSGLKLPETFDLKGIMMLGLQVVGATWDNLQAKLVKALGPNGQKILDAAKSGLAVVQRVMKEGPIALWDIFVEKAGEIKDAVFDGVKGWAIGQIVKKATIKLVSMLNPAGAIFQAIMLIYDLVMFFVENWDRIVSFVQSIFESITNIAAGAIAQAANFIEKALGKTIPMILSFLASFIGLGGIGKAVRKVIETLRKPIDKIIDKVVGFLVKAIKKVFGRLTGKKGEKAKDDKVEDPQKEVKLQKGMTDIDKEEQKYLKGGEITFEDAEKVAREVKRKHPVFKKIVVVEGKETFDYEYEASKRRRKKGEKGKKKGGGGLPEGLKLGDFIFFINEPMASMPLNKAFEGKKNVYKIISVDEKVKWVYLIAEDGYMKKPMKLDEFIKAYKKKEIKKFNFSKGVPHLDPQVVLSWNTDSFDEEDKKEFLRQIKLQEASINAMTIVYWLKHYKSFHEKGGGRDERDSDARKKFRKEYKERYMESLSESNFKKMKEILKSQGKDPSKLSEKKLKKMVEKEGKAVLKGLDATHGPDSVGGGHYKGFHGFGKKNINRSIGSQWDKRNSEILKKEVDIFIKTPKYKNAPQNLQIEARMKVKMKL